MQITLFDLATRFVGLSEFPGSHSNNDQIMAMLRLDQPWPENDEVPWCSAFLNYCAWLLRLPRSKHLAARSWLSVGKPIAMHDAEPKYDVVIFARPSRNKASFPGPEAGSVQDGFPPGHVGLFAGLDWREGFAAKNQLVQVLGGNQSNRVGISYYPMSRILGARRLYEEEEE